MKVPLTMQRHHPSLLKTTVFKKKQENAKRNMEPQFDVGREN